jgi:A/G-specific adenine glycosylase
MDCVTADNRTSARTTPQQRLAARKVVIAPNHRRTVKRLLAWSKQNTRKFPWRVRRSPYRVLLAEKLLQQTAARDAVAYAYRELIAYCPTPAKLASAHVGRLKKIIRPLGFLYRARELKALGKILSTRFSGSVPADLRSLLQLPGVGDYAARAVLSFAYKENTPVVDTNVARFLHRFFGLNSPIPSNPARSKALLNLAANLLPPGESIAFNFAILDLCAAVCVPNKPKCDVCPMRSGCYTGQTAVHSQSILVKGDVLATGPIKRSGALNRSV